MSPRRVQRVSHSPELAVINDTHSGTLCGPQTTQAVIHPTTANILAYYTTMPEVMAADPQNAILDKARKLYSDGKFKAALAAFKEAGSQICTEAMTNTLLTHHFKALLRCPCTRQVMVQSKKMGLSLKEIQISRCHCKNFESLPICGSPKLAMYALAKRSCTCGSDVLHCNVASHLIALDGMVATYEKLQAPVKARQYATLLIITSPRVPEGYLRLAKALRLCDTEQSPGTIARCRWIYRQAIQSVQTYGNKDHGKLKFLASLLRMDIVSSVPAELQTMILGNLGNSDLCRSMRVSKTWRRACLDPGLWRHLQFIRSFGTPRRPLRKGVLNNIISKRAQGKAKNLTLWGVDNLGIDLPTLKATLKVLNQLESLSLKGVSGIENERVDWQAVPLGETWSTTVFAEAPPCLKTLHLGGFRPTSTRLNWPPPSRIPMAQSLEELSLTHVTTISIAPGLLCSTVWPKLKKLTISTISQKETLEVDLLRLVHATPSLKDLSIHNLKPLAADSTPSWESLERLELSVKLVDQNHALGLTPPLILFAVVDPQRPLPRLLPTIRSLEFPDRALKVLRLYERIAHPHPNIDPSDGSLPPVAELERLEHLYLRDTSIQYNRVVDSRGTLAWFMELIKPSMSNGSLTSLAISFYPDTRFSLDMVLNKAAIRTLSCFDFHEEEYGTHCGETFATWVQDFTHLTTLGVFPQKSEGCWMHVSKVLARESRIETIYTNVLTGQPRDWILAKAKEKGVKIVEASRIPEPVLEPLELEPGDRRKV